MASGVFVLKDDDTLVPMETAHFAREANFQSLLAKFPEPEIKIRLKEPERLALDQRARARDTSAANWVRSLTVVHLSGRPQWAANELNELRTISDHLCRIGSDINVMAGIINGAVRTGT